MKETAALDEPQLRGWFRAGTGRREPRRQVAAIRTFTERQAQEEIDFPPNGNRSALDFAVFLLRAAAEIEHSLLIQYLYAAYSINEQQTQDRSNLALSWKFDIRLVAREEMAHLITVQNLLLALKQHVYFNRGSLHRDPDVQPVPFMLEPLSLESLAKFVITESPSSDQMDEDSKKEMKEVQRIADKLKNVEAVSRVGVLYTALHWLFLPSDQPADWDFPSGWIGQLVHQYGPGFHLKTEHFVEMPQYDDRVALPEEWGIYEVDAHADPGSPREKALAAIFWIMSQGEGRAGRDKSHEQSHFLRFLSIFKQARTMGQKAFETLIFKVPVNPIAEYRAVRKGTTPIRNPFSKALGELSNIRYRLLLLDTMLSLASSRKAAMLDRIRFAEWAIVEMEFVKRLGNCCLTTALVTGPLDLSPVLLFKHNGCRREPQGENLCKSSSSPGLSEPSSH
jgi:hypothetical protein